MSKGGGGAPVGSDGSRRSIGIAASAALVIIALALAFVGADGDDEPLAVDTAPRLVESGELSDLEGSLGHEVYWAGELPPNRLELTEEASGSVYVRYLPAGVAAGDPRGEFLVVGTYPVADGQAAVRRAAAAAGVEVSRVGDDGIAFADPAAKGSAYLAYPGSSLQIEVYDPVPGRALELIRAGEIRPVGEG